MSNCEQDLQKFVWYEGRSCSKSNYISIKIFNYPFILPNIILFIFKVKIFVINFLIKIITPVCFINNNAIISING